MSSISGKNDLSAGISLARFSLGIGDRFGRAGAAQLAALQAAQREGIAVTPVWNKSNREHALIGTRPEDTRQAADAAVRAAGWRQPYRLDADHVGLANVEKFLDAYDFFTLDVADLIGKPAPADVVKSLVERVKRLFGTRQQLAGSGQILDLAPACVQAAAATYAAAVAEAGRIYRRIVAHRGPDGFVTEVSTDEANAPQTPAELLVILTALATEGIPVRTIAPRFSGRFNKGVDYVGDPQAFKREFEADVAVLALAKSALGLPSDLKLSVHSGSDKFSIYGSIRDVLARTGAGIHLKTAGTTWLEEVVGLALSGGEGLAFVKDIWRLALDRREELAKPYATVIDIDPAKLPSAEEVSGWDGSRFAAALRHDPSCPRFNPHLRQLLHVSFPLAAEAGPRYLALLDANRDTVAHEVTVNLLDRHIRRVFPAS
ncbi:MAG: tagaturonate epimerase family protein [Kiritimatiellia bacterium]|jgi:hypothetical protein